MSHDEDADSRDSRPWIDTCAMATEFNIGDKGKTLGPLKPEGRIVINGITMDAASEGMWIDADADIVIVGGNSRRPIVRVYPSDQDLPRNCGQPLLEASAVETTPLQAPPAWVERTHTVLLGLAIGIVLVPIAWLFGTPLSVYAFFVPVSGAIAGWLFRVFVGTAIETVGPREDHRPRARVTALIVSICALGGAAIGANVGMGYLGLSCGITLGAFVGGMLCYAGWIVSNV